MFKQYALDVATALSGISQEKVEALVDLLRRAKFQNASVYLVGNGGSAATASHAANDLVKTAGIRAVSLADATPTLLAYGNDNGWENMFAEFLRKVLLPQDVVICISCSGNSPNVVEALKMVKSHAMPLLRSAVLTGANYDCALSALGPDVCIFVPFRDIRVQEDCHLAILHYAAGAMG